MNRVVLALAVLLALLEDVTHEEVAGHPVLEGHLRGLLGDCRGVVVAVLTSALPARFTEFLRRPVTCAGPVLVTERLVLRATLEDAQPPMS